MRHFLKPFLIVFLFSSLVFSQDSFKQGYYIDNASTKINGLILDSNPYNNPSEIVFKVNETDAAKTIGIESIKEYSISERNTRYKRFKVEIDVNYTMSNNIDKIASTKVENTSLFKVLVEGELSLYKLVINDKVVFFYKQKEELTPKQLENTSYTNNNGTLSETNGYFRRQLIKSMNCNDFKSIPSFLELAYTEKELIKLFKEYNTCVNSDYVEYKENTQAEKASWKFTPFIGMNFSTLKYNLLESPFSPSSSLSSINFGVETSLILPYNNKAYEVFFSIGIDKVDDVSSGSYRSGTFSEIFENLTFKSTLINFNLGPRYNYYLNQKSKLFFDASVGLSIPNDDIIYEYYTETTIDDVFYTTQGQDRSYKTDSALFFNFGMGYCFNNKFGIDLRYSTPKEYLEGKEMKVTLSSIGATLRYTIN